jgi:putative ABC transport system permease protein
MSAETKSEFLRPRWSKIFSDLWEDKTRTSLVVASIAVGVFAMGMILTAFDILSHDINASFASVNPANLEIWTDPFQENLVRVIASIPGVDEVEGRYILGVRARKAASAWKSVSLVGLDGFEQITINRLATLAGTPIPGRDEVVVSQDINNNTGFQVGDQIEVELPSGSLKTLTVVGLVTDQTTTKLQVASGANVFLTFETLRSFGLGALKNRLLITVDGDGSDAAFVSNLAALVKTKVERNNRQVYRIEEQLSTEHPMIKTLSAIMGVLGALGGLITLLSGSLIINMLTALMTQQLRQIGVMKLIGGRSSQILGMYLTLIVIYSLISLVLAVPLGTWAGNAMAGFIASLLGATVQGFRVVPTAVVAQALLAFLVPLGAGYFPVRAGAKVDVRQALSAYRPGDQLAKRSFLNLNWVWTNWVSRPILLSFRNTFRKMGRVLLTIFTLTIAGAVFIAVFNVRATLNNVLEQVMQHFQGDVTLTFRQPYPVDQVERVLITNLPGVEGIEGWGGAKAEIRDTSDALVTNLSISAPPEQTQLLNPELVAGRWLLPAEKKALVVSDSIYKFYPHLVPGETLTVKLPGHPKEDWVVVGIFRFLNLLGDPLAYANSTFIANQIGLPNQAFSFRIVTAEHDAASQQVLADRIDRFLSERNYAVESVKTGKSLRESTTAALDPLISFLLIMAILTALVGSIGLTGTMSINVLERTREIGVMRTIGAVDGVIMQSVILEALVIGLITWILAIGLSFPISSALLIIIGQTMLGSAMQMIFTPFGVVLWLVIVVVLSVVASLLPARKAARLTINEVLAYE